MDVVHTPRYLLRRNLILRMLKHYRPGSFLEIGCGRGELLRWLAARQFTGVGYEISARAGATAKRNFSTGETGLEVIDDLYVLGERQFKYVFAFEVLEHIEDDTAALIEWRRWLEPEGLLIISVPAHMAMWSVADERGGHYRRYEKAPLKRLLERCGYAPQRLWNYGFPLTAVTPHLRSLLYRPWRREQSEQKSMEERAMDSSWESTIPWKRGSGLASYAMEGIALGFHALQLGFLDSDLGDGYLVASELRT